MTSASHEGQALSWRTDDDGLCTLSLHREPLNELGEVSLAELERFVQPLEMIVPMVEIVDDSHVLGGCLATKPFHDCDEIFRLPSPAPVVIET